MNSAFRSWYSSVEAVPERTIPRRVVGKVAHRFRAAQISSAGHFRAQSAVTKS